MKNKKLIVTSLMVAVGIVLFLFFRQKEDINSSQTYVVILGQIEGKKQYKGILNPFSIQWFYNTFNKEVISRCENGKAIKKGEVVLSYDVDYWDDEIESHQEGIDDKNVVLVELRLQHQSENEKAILLVEEQKLKYERTAFIYQLAVDSPIQLIRDEQNLILKKEELKKDFIANRFKLDEEVYKKELISLKTLQASKIKLLNAESNYLRVKIKYAEAMKGASIIWKKQLKKQLELEQMKYDDARDNIKRIKIIQEFEINKELGAIQNISNKIKRFKRNKVASEVRAPFDSKVYFPGIYKGSSSSEPIEVGETPIKGVGLLFFTNSSDYVTNFIISESELTEIKIGDAVTFQLKSDAAVLIDGVVSRFSPLTTDKNVQLGSLALERNGEAGVRVIEVTAKLNSSDNVLRQGITGIVYLKKKNPLQLICPLEYVSIKDDKLFVTLKGHVTKEITVGQNDGFMTEVLSGLKKGDILTDD